MTKSEFDPYLNMTYLALKNDAYFCLDNGRYIAHSTNSDSVNRIEKLCDRVEENATVAIVEGDIELLSKLEKQDTALDALIAKLTLSFIQYKNN